jgi:hypothetical protein
MNPLWKIPIAVALVGTVVFQAGADEITPSATALADQKVVRPPEDSAPLPRGSAAIKPSTTATPAFSVDDVKKFVTTHRFPFSISRDRKYSISRIEFLSSRQVSDLLNGAYTGFPDDYMLCYVELQGTFTFPGPMGSTVTYHRGIEIFDAGTGNFLISGGLP